MARKQEFDAGTGATRDLWHATDRHTAGLIQKKGLRAGRFAEEEPENYTVGPREDAIDFAESTFGADDGKYSLVHLRVPEHEMGDYFHEGPQSGLDPSGSLQAVRRPVPPKYVHEVTHHVMDDEAR